MSLPILPLLARLLGRLNSFGFPFRKCQQAHRLKILIFLTFHLHSVHPRFIAKQLHTIPESSLVLFLSFRELVSLELLLAFLISFLISTCL